MESDNGVIILKPGKKLFAEFNCDVCGCQYRALAKNCTIFTTIGSFAAPYVTHSCPCCGLTNQCMRSDLKECDI
jgi:hypothetical protein